MILVNTTFYVHPTVEDEFLAWVKSDYIASASKAGLSSPQLSVILAEVGEEVTGYALQLHASDLATAEAWHDAEGACVRGAMLARHGQKMLFFTTYMEILDL